MNSRIEAAGEAPGLLVSPTWLQARLGDPHVVVLDCTAYLDDPPDPVTGHTRAQREFRAAHIPGARRVDLERVFSDPHHAVRFMAPEAAALSRALEHLGIGVATRVVVYSRGEMWTATRVWWVLRLHGFDRCSVLDGGWALWKLEGRSTASGDEPPHLAEPPEGSRPFVARRRPALYADAHGVLDGLARQDVAVVNARTAPFFRGDGGNVYGRPGRIAGSVNLPAASHLDPATQTFLPVAELRRQFDQVVQPGTDVIAYCGYGIAASGTVFVLALLGHEGARLYDGSLAEWAADARLPMASGPEASTPGEGGRSSG